jgi:hypothetical protein
MAIEDFTSKVIGGSLTRVTEPQLQQAEDQKKAEEDAAKQVSNTYPVLGVSSYVRKCFDVAKQSWENDLHERLLKCLRQKNGQYDPDILAKIRESVSGGSENYRNITQIKTKAFEGWAMSSLFPPGDKCWTIGPTPNPELPENREAEIVDLVTKEVTQMFIQDGVFSVDDSKINERLLEVKDKVKKELLKKAKISAARVEVILDDQLTEGGFYTALREVILDMATFPVCWLVGPEVRKRKKFKWVTNPDGTNKLTVIDKIVREWRRASPFCVFPSPGSKSINDGYLCELISLKRSELASMIGVEGFSESQIRLALKAYGEGGLREWLASDEERKEAEYKPYADDDPNPPIQAIVFWGECQGKKLIEWGMDKEDVPDETIDYQVCVWLVGTYAIMVRLNPSPLGKKPYYATSFDKVNDSIIGNAIPEAMRDDQMRCCGAGRAIDNNMAFSAGPMTEIYWQRFKPGSNPASQIRPYAILQTDDDMSGQNNPAVRFYQPTIIADVLIRVDEYFLRQAGEKTIPSYVYGSITGRKDTAIDTASGMSMMLNANLKNLQGSISHLETDIIVPAITEHWNHVMLYDDDIEKFGDVAVVPKASEHLLVEEQRQMRAQELFERVDRSDTAKRLLGLKGMANLLREVVKITKMDPTDMVPDDDDIDAMIAAEAELAVPVSGQPGGGTVPGTPVTAGGASEGKEPGNTMQSKVAK